MAERVDVARHRFVQHLLLAAVRQVGERHALVREAAVDVVERPLVAAVHEQVVHRRRELVAGRAGDGPVARQLLAAAEDLLDDDEERPVGGAGRLHALLEPLQVVAGIEEAVHVVDAEAGHGAALDEREDEAVHLVEDRRIFHAQRRQLVHVEEPAVVDLLGRHAPVREAIRLRVQQAVERVEAPRLPVRPVEPPDAAVDELAHAAAAIGERREPALDHFLLARAHGDRFRAALGPRRQVAARRQDAEQLVGVVAGMIGEPVVQILGDDAIVGVWRERQRLLVVADEERAVAVRERELLVLQHLAVLIAEDWNQQLLGELVLHRVPLDVEEAREARARPVLEHVEPPRVRRLRDPHVVRHDVHHVSHAARAERAGPRRVIGVGADLRVELCRIGDVVPVRAAGHGFQVRGGIAVADAEIVQVVHDGVRLPEREAAVELQPVSCEGNTRRSHQVRK